jgi:hypothetical protein
MSTDDPVVGSGSQLVLRIRFIGPDIDFAKVMAFETTRRVNSVLARVDAVRRAAGWADELPPSGACCDVIVMSCACSQLVSLSLSLSLSLPLSL